MSVTKAKYASNIKGGVNKAKNLAEYNGTQTTLVAITSASTSYVYSKNGGQNWITGTLPVASSGITPNCNLGYGRGLFVMTPYNTNTFYTSPDGITWTSRALGWSNHKSMGVVYGAPGFVSFTYNDSGQYGYSADGITWANKTGFTTSSSVSGYQSKSGIWYSISTTATAIITTAPETSTGAKETLTSFAASPYMTGNGPMASDGWGTQVLPNTGNTTQGWRVREYYPDYGGVAASVTMPAGTNNWNSVAYGNGVFVAPSADTLGATAPGGTVSNGNGTPWTSRTFPTGFSGGLITYCNTSPIDPGFVMISYYGGGSTRTAVSADGITWTTYGVNASINAHVIKAAQNTY